MSPSEVMGVMTGFSPARAKTWPTIGSEHFTVHERGDTWAEVAEGTEGIWECACYEWDSAGNTVKVTALDSKVFGPGGGWVFRMTPEGQGTGVDPARTGAPDYVQGQDARRDLALRRAGVREVLQGTPQERVGTS
ncbi:hypothetical protein ACWEBX_40095, partial [Streptomyces sp. NPDC005070]